jgi:hypothetical protein
MISAEVATSSDESSCLVSTGGAFFLSFSSSSLSSLSKMEAPVWMVGLFSKAVLTGEVDDVPEPWLCDREH